MRTSRIQIAKQDIEKFFNDSSQLVFSRSDLDQILMANRSFWRLTASTTTLQFVDFLKHKSQLRQVDLEFPSRKYIRYCWKRVDAHPIAISLRPKSYLSHFTAAAIHGLTLQVPKTIYVNAEQTGRSTIGGELEQENVARAFASRQRISQSVSKLENLRICLVTGQNTGGVGVINMESRDPLSQHVSPVKVTNLERTLIDVAVRPAYSGGVNEVMNIYREAAERVSINKLNALLSKIDYKYPYHQTIGFYLSRTGSIPSHRLDLLKQKGMKIDFYLTYDMGEVDYDEEWRLFYPSGLS